MLWSWIVILNTLFIVVFHIQWEGDWINKSIPPNKMNLQRQNKQETHAANNIWPTFRILQISMHVEKEVQGSCLKRRQFYWSLMCCNTGFHILRHLWGLPDSSRLSLSTCKMSISSFNQASNRYDFNGNGNICISFELEIILEWCDFLLGFVPNKHVPLPFGDMICRL